MATELKSGTYETVVEATKTQGGLGVGHLAVPGPDGQDADAGRVNMTGHNAPPTGLLLSIEFGAMVPHIHEQLQQAGFRVSKKEIEPYQQDANYLTSLMIRGILTQRECDTGRKRLLRDLARYLQNKPTRG